MTDKTDKEFFSIGDKVRHRASGREAIVTNTYSRCANPKHTMALLCMGNDECEIHLIDKYDISLDFGEPIEGVCSVILEYTEEVSSDE